MGDKGTRTLVIRRVHEEARDIRAFDVLPEGARDCHDIVFTPGQVALLEVGDAGRAHFAIASSPEDDELEVLRLGVSALQQPERERNLRFAVEVDLDQPQTFGDGFGGCDIE